MSQNTEKHCVYLCVVLDRDRVCACIWLCAHLSWTHTPVVGRRAGPGRSAGRTHSGPSTEAGRSGPPLGFPAQRSHVESDSQQRGVSPWGPADSGKMKIKRIFTKKYIYTASFIYTPRKLHCVLVKYVVRNRFHFWKEAFCDILNVHIFRQSVYLFL